MGFCILIAFIVVSIVFFFIKLLGDIMLIILFVIVGLLLFFIFCVIMWEDNVRLVNWIFNKWGMKLIFKGLFSKKLFYFLWYASRYY